MELLAAVLSGIAGNQIWVFAGLLVLVLLIIAVMAAILLRARSAAPPAPAEPAALPPPDATAEEGGAVPALAATAPDVTIRDIRRLFRDGLAAYRETLSRNVYLVPWYLRTGVAASDDAGLLSCAEEVRPPVTAERHAGFSWRFYDRAVVIDVDDPRAAWAGVLDLLGRRRPMLPADGLILTVPLAELDDVRRATARGTELYARLWEIQRTLGFALPVYVVVTGCEEAPGFAALAEALPPSLTGGMLGWSSPYALETAFSPDFVSEALQSLADGLLAVELEVFGAAATPDGAPLFALTERLTGTEAALRALLGTAFKRTAYQETLYVRGLYFTGRPDPDAAALFGRDLLNRKIFPEAGLPKPTRALAASRAWRRYSWPVGTGAAALAAVLLLWMGVQRASTLSDRLVPVLADIPGGLQQLADQRPAVEAGAPMTAAYGDPAARFVQGVTMLPTDWTFNPLPASWISGVPDSVSGALAVGYRRLALSTVRDVAEDRLRRLTRDGGVGPAGAGAFERLRAFAGEVGIAEGLARAYNNVDSRDPTLPLDEVLDFALGSGVARGFSARLHGWEIDQPPGGTAIPAPGPGAQRPIDLTAHRAEVSRRFRQYADAYLRDLAMGGLAAARLSVAASELELLAGGARSGADAAAAYAEVLSSLEDAARGLGAERGAWIGANGPVLPPEFEALLGRLEKSDLLGPNLRADILDLAQRRYDEAGVGARSLDSVIGRLLEQAPNGGARLAPAAEQLRRTLAVWMARRFMKTDDTGALAMPAVGAGWDRAALDSIPPLVEDYLLFDAKDLPQAPAMLRTSMRAAAQHQLRQGVERILARALAGSPAGGGVDRAGGLAQLRASAHALRTAFPVLAETMQSFRQIGLTTSADTIRDTVARQANAVLAQADRLLEGDQLYRPDAHALDVWVDGPLVPHLLFGQTTPAGLALYLGNARQEVTVLARDIAAPVVEILERPVMGAGTGSGAAAKWARIITELDKYDGGRPNSSLAQLEKFVTVESAAVDAAGCQNLGAIDGVPDDFFRSRLAELKQWIATRCVLAADARVYDAYVDMAASFNEMLAGRFPFAAAAVPGEDADPAAVRAFYERFDARSAFVLEGLRRGERFGTAGREALRFVETMERARPLLIAAVTPDQSGGLALDPAFRVNRGREAGGSDIIEWKLATPNGALSSVLPRTPLRWYPGDKLSLTLRWAKDGTVLPVSGVGAGVTVDGPSLRFDYDGPWALFALAGRQAAPQRDRRPGPDTEPLLLFEATASGPVKEAAAAAPMPIAPAVQAVPQPAVKPNVRVFMTLAVKRTVLADGKPPREEKVAVPALPAQAPPLAPVGSMRRMPGLAGWPAPSGAVAPADRAFFDLGNAPSQPPMLRPAAQRFP
ncbi:type VI secretion system protein ImpL [Azospirillum baldaniorum]|uniref:type VI secretion system protein n=1 Tax=Azospirillum baldaniorum TaxID=1064539 RepID=UPI0011A78C73|nr:type VI secretion system protein [Azospirillum baldaniorum]TWA57964.1 type VI secretion system protein ImpL [Azospirillum baldaniorum]